MIENIKLSEKINLWRAIVRDYTLPQTVISYVFAVILACKFYQVNLLFSFLGLTGVLLAHMSVNIWDDFFDWKNGVVDEYKKLVEQGEQAKTHKCFYLEEGLTSHKSLFFVASIMDFFAGCIGLFLAFKVGFIVLAIAAAAGFLGIFYSAPPLKFSYRGMSEFVIGIVYGPLLLSGAYIVAGGSFDKNILFSSIIIGILVANISFVHCIMDYKSDVKCGKTSLATIMGSPQNAVKLLGWVYFIAFLIFFIGIYLGLFPFASALVFILIPKIFALLKLMLNEDRKRKFWMGYLGNWDYVIKEGSDWFMMRLCISRNIVVEFIFIFAFTYYLFG